MSTRPFSLSLLCALFCICSACYPTPGPDKTFAGAVLGAGWGAGAGAVVGHQFGAIGEGAAIGAGFGAFSGLLTGAGLDVAEGTELQQQRSLDALKVQVSQNTRRMYDLQARLDNREQLLKASQTSARVYFDEGASDLKAGDTQQLEQVSQVIKLNPYVTRVQVHGHSDDTGNMEINDQLSQERAEAVATFLSKQGISWHTMEVLSHGAKRPLASNRTSTGRQLNRRVDIVLLSRIRG